MKVQESKQQESKQQESIYGIGTDICDVRRIRASYERYGERFAQRILTPQEMRVFHLRSARWPDRGMRYLATRFSAKESFSKAIGLGMRSPMTWRSCEIMNTASGQPQIVLYDQLLKWCQAKGLSAKVSVSDESDYAVSFVTVTQNLSSLPT